MTSCSLGSAAPEVEGDDGSKRRGHHIPDLAHVLERTILQTQNTRRKKEQRSDDQYEACDPRPNLPGFMSLRLLKVLSNTHSALHRMPRSTCESRTNSPSRC